MHQLGDYHMRQDTSPQRKRRKKQITFIVQTDKLENASIVEKVWDI
jgi:hypothetical protein